MSTNQSTNHKKVEDHGSVEDQKRYGSPKNELFRENSSVAEELLKSIPRCFEALGIHSIIHGLPFFK